MNRFILFLFPFAMDIVVALSLFVGRHSLASRGFDESVVGTIPMCYGIGYIVACALMGRIIRPGIARIQMVVGAVLFGILCAGLANIEHVRVIQIMFCLVPLAASLFFNAFQSFMLTVSNDTAKPLSVTTGQYTFSWSLGFALGPLICSLVKSSMSWDHTYYIAAGIALLVAVAGVAYRATAQPAKGASESEADVQVQPLSLALAAWIWLVAGWGIWLMISTFWPVRATQLGFSPMVKGSVEFALAATQAFAALALIGLRGWTMNPRWIPVFGGVGAAALVLFGSARTPALFIAAIILYGIHTAAMFNFMMYHAFVNPAKAVKRVAVNEMLVGVCFMVGPVGAAVLSRTGLSFFTNYLIVAVVLVVSTTVAAMIAMRLLNGTSKRAGCT